MFKQLWFSFTFQLQNIICNNLFKWINYVAFIFLLEWTFWTVMQLTFLLQDLQMLSLEKLKVSSALQDL